MKIKFYEDCIPIKGYKRSLIFDTTREKIKTIPNSLYEFIIKYDKYSIDAIKKKYTKSEIIIIDQYINFLLQNEFAFEIDKQLVNNFPKISLDWEIPSFITNTIISLSSGDWKSRIKKIIYFIDEINCQDVEIRFTNKTNELEIKDLLESFSNSRVNSIMLIVPYFKISDFFYEILLENKRLDQIIFYNSPNIKKVELKYETNQILFTEKSLDNIFKLCNISQFITNLSLLCEAQKHHTYFNRKLYINEFGLMKNAPETEIEFGIIDDLKCTADLTKIIDNSLFKKYWSLSKDNCDVCKLCEFRYICVDNRLPTKREDGTSFHEVECNYNPYICKWEGEKGYANLVNIGVVSNAEGLFEDFNLIDSTNKNLSKFE